MFLLLAGFVTCICVLIVVRCPVCLDRMIPALYGPVFSGCGEYTLLVIHNRIFIALFRPLETGRHLRNFYLVLKVV